MDRFPVEQRLWIDKDELVLIIASTIALNLRIYSKI